MAHKATERVDPVKLRKETREWLATRTIPHAREIAADLENAGEDVHDLLAAIDELESLVNVKPPRSGRTSEKAEA